LINDGSGGWTATTLFTVAAGPIAEIAFAVEAGDLDGDGYPDVVVSRTGGGFRAYRNFGGTLALQPLGVFSTGKHHVLADFDGDGDLDMATRQSSTTLRTYANLGGFVFTLGSSYGLPPAAGDPLHVVDLDGDADPDLIVGQHLALNVGAFGWSYPSQTASSIPATSFPRASIDFDLDGDPDFFSREGPVTRNLGGGVFAPWFTLPSQFAPHSAGDVDGDGLIDLLLRGPTLHVDLSRRLALRRPARPGFLTGFDVYGPAGGAWLLGVNADPLPTPPTTTPYGRLFLDPFTLTLVGGGSLDAAGFAAVEALLPASAASLVGSTFHFQAVVDGDAAGPRLTNARSLVVTPP
ncbi:MAG TPA: VCBS repeat-containing protein, partial [Planctomycetota bacterium]|nr:VCBS repeat-containing protein [Planctomycetota bacterium]